MGTLFCIYEIRIYNKMDFRKWQMENGFREASKIIIEVADRETAKFLLGSIEAHLRNYVDENETAKIIDTRIESEVA